MKYLKKYENLDPFYLKKLYWLEILFKSGYNGIPINDIEKTVEVLKKLNCEYRLYYHASENKNQCSSVIFLTPEKNRMKLPNLEFFSEVDELPDNMENYRIEFEDLEIIINANKYNL